MNWGRGGGGCFKNGFNSKSDKRCHLDPSDPSEISLLKRKNEKKGRGRGEEKRERKKGKERRKKGSAFILFQMWDLMGKNRGRRKEGKRKRHLGTGLSNPERPVAHCHSTRDCMKEVLQERSRYAGKTNHFNRGVKVQRNYIWVQKSMLLTVTKCRENKESFPHSTLMLNFGIN